MSVLYKAAFIRGLRSLEEIWYVALPNMKRLRASHGRCSIGQNTYWARQSLTFIHLDDVSGTNLGCRTERETTGTTQITKTRSFDLSILESGI